jgi:hypothetical protein
LKKEYEASSRPEILAEKLRGGVGVAVRSNYLAADLRAVELDVACKGSLIKVIRFLGEKSVAQGA